MFSIGFYPELDSHHAIFRYFCISRRFPKLRVDTYRIIDYFFLNPFDLHTFRTSGHSHRKLSETFSNLRPYRRTSEPAGVALQMWQFQQACLSALARREFISPSALSNDVVLLVEEDIPVLMRSLVEAEIKAKSDVLDFLESMIARYPLGGQGGLKDRSGLLDFRYDVKNAAAA